MDAQIRLAARQGLLIGNELSMAQVASVYLSELQAMRGKAEDNVFSLKAALLGTGRVTFAELFPDESTDDEQAAKDLVDDGDDYGIDGITYKFTRDEDFDPAEAERLLDSLIGEGDMVVSGREMLDWGDSE